MHALAGWLGGGVNPFEGSRQVLDAWRKGDALAEKTVDVAAHGLARGLASVVSLFAPELLVVGGGLGAGNPDYLEKVEALTRPLITPYFRDHWRLVPSELGEQVVTQGAAALARAKAPSGA